MSFRLNATSMRQTLGWILVEAGVFAALITAGQVIA